MKKRTLIIAEAGVNHNGDINMALQLIDAAADAGADLVKFQTFDAARLATADAKKAQYQAATSGSDESQYQMLRRLELSFTMHRMLIEHCEARGITFFSTGFDIDSVNLLMGLGVDRIKIPSGEITNLPYLRHVGSLCKPIIMSTGMATLGEIEAAIDIIELAGTPRENVTVLHCTTEYPAPFDQIHLRAMQSIGQALGVDVGYSDHTAGIEVSIAATALGATIIEKHFTLDRSLPGPDHSASLEPNELRAMVSAIRNVELALGENIKRTGIREAENRVIVRKSLVASQPIRAGERFTSQNLTTKRPGTGICPMRWDEIIGKTATKDYVVDEIIVG